MNIRRWWSRLLGRGPAEVCLIQLAAGPHSHPNFLKLEGIEVDGVSWTNLSDPLQTLIALADKHEFVVRKDGRVIKLIRRDRE